MNKKEQSEQINKSLESAKSDMQFYKEIVKEKKADIEFWNGKIENCQLVINSLERDKNSIK